jgi:CRP-like cAMP-binding protein
MAEADKQQVALDALKSFNAAVTTTKLYPPRFPQVTAAVEKAFLGITGYLEKYGPLSFSLVEDEPKLCGLPVSKKTLGKMHGEDVYQHLRLLQLDHVVLEKELSEKTFKQLLTFFTTSPRLVNREGGGRAFVVNLGLNDFFPQEYRVELPDEREDTFKVVLDFFKEEGRLPDNIGLLSDEIDSETVSGQKKISFLASQKKQPEKLVDLIVSSIADLLQGMTRMGEIDFPPAFAATLRNVNRFTSDEERIEVAGRTAGACLQLLDDFALHILLLQNYSRGFGLCLYEALLQGLGKRFDTIVELVREEEVAVVKGNGADSAQHRHVKAGLERLFATEKGKQFLVRDKAKKLIEEGEKDRQMKRIQAGISSILRGDLHGLKNREVVKHLPATVESLIAKGKDKAAAAIITNITTELVKGDKNSHALLSETLSLIGDSLINTSKWDWLEKLEKPMMAWVKDAEHGDDVYENIVDILLKTLKYYWKNEKEEKADKLLRLFFAIRTGKLEKPAEIVAIVERLQDLSVEKAPLSALLQRSINEKNELVDRRLIMQGPLVARFLLNTLLDSEETVERLKILELLRRMGPLLPPLLLEKLAEPMPWHGKRNVIQLLAETGTEKEASLIFDYLNHEDIRVQKEAFSCIYKLSGEDKKSNLLEVLSLATGPMKEQVVRALSPLADEEVVTAVAGLLDDWKHFADEVRDSLLTQVVGLLAKRSSRSAEEALEQFLKVDAKEKARIIGEPVLQQAGQALRRVKNVRRELGKKQLQHTMAQGEDESGVEDVSQPLETVKPGRRTDYPEEGHIETLIVEGDLDRARKLLVDLIERAVAAKRFDDAVTLREWLMEFAPTALNDIIRTAEIIEEGKSEGISNDFLEIWSHLHDNLSTEEFNALYYSLEAKTFSEEELLVRQGEMQPALFFVNQGKVKLYFEQKNAEILLKVIGQGEIFGAETFFDASVWTVSATALRRSEVSVLPLSKIVSWHDEYPSLNEKLQNLAESYSQIQDSLEELKKSRREHKRHQVEGNVTAVIVEEDRRNEGLQMKGELADVSAGGASYHVRISSKKNARILLGREVQLQIPCRSARNKQLNVDGVLMTVRSLYSMTNDYSAHVRFKNLLKNEDLQGIIEAGQAGR